MHVAGRRFTSAPESRAKPGNVRVGLVGVGRWGSNYLRTLRDHPHVQLAALCDADSAALARATSDRPLPTFSHLAALLAAGVDAVILATPPETHAALAVAALDAGAHVLVEKPLSTTVDGAAAVVAAAHRSRRVCAVGHLTLHHEALAPGAPWRRAIGRIERVSAERTSFGASHSAESAIFGLASHDVATLLGPLELRARRVRARALAPPSGGQPPQAVVLDLVLEHPRGSVVTAEIRVSRLGPSRVRRASIEGALGSFVFDEVREEPREGLLRRQCDAFAARVHAGDASTREARLGADVVRVLVAAHTSMAASGAWIDTAASVEPSEERAL
ncbi:MAG: Gfo/Idh/MocA family oxidoreductase [Polyangiaceae bacterium]